MYLVSKAWFCFFISVADVVEHLTSTDYSQRKLAAKKLGVLANKAPSIAFPILINQAANSPEPEVRERAICCLKEMAIAEYNQIGDGYAGLQMSIVSQLIEVPDKGRVATVDLFVLVPGGPAEKAGLKVGDKVVSIDGTTKNDTENFNEFVVSSLRAKGAGNSVAIGVLRDAKYLEFELRLSRRPKGLDQLATNPPMIFGGGNVQLGVAQNQMGIDVLVQKDMNSDEFFIEWLQNKNVAVEMFPKT